MSLLSSVVPIQPGATPQNLQTSSSVGAIPRSDPHLHDVANILGLNLPPNALKVLSQCQASGRLSELANSQSAKVPAPAARRTTKAKRTTARSHTQPNLIKSGGASAHARGVPIPKAVPQPLEAVQYQPPPAKARARRVALAAESKAKDASSPSIWGLPSAVEQLAFTAFWGDRAKSVSFPTLQLPGGVEKAGQSQNEVMPLAFAASAEPSRAPTRPTTPSGDRLKSASLPALQQPALLGPTRAAASISQASLIDRLLPRLRGIVDAAAAHPKRSQTWVVGDTTTLGTTTSSSSSSNGPLALYEPPFPPTIEMPEAETLDVELPTVEQPAMDEPTTSHPTPTTAHRAESESPTTKQNHPSVTLLTFEDLEALFRLENPCIAIPEPVQEDASAALDRILDLELSQVLQECGATQATPLTRTEIEMSLFPSSITTHLGYTTGVEGDVEMADAEIDDLLRLAVDLLDESWVGFVDFEGYHGV